MMLPTHVLVGLAIATPLAAVLPEHAPAILVGAILGSVLPDLDMYVGHRRTLHYPTIYPLAGSVAVAGAALAPHPWLVGTAAVLVAAGLHCRMDRYGGGLSLRPWEGNSDHGVYDHVRGHWRAPKRWIRYDGAPEDVGLAVALGLPLLLVTAEPYRLIVVAALLVGAVYGLVRRRLPDLAVVLSSLPLAPLRRHIPQRYRKES